ncbi:MAG: YgjP-like metallopeptidase domain-containing protein [Bacilli bacterium]
MKVIIDNQEYIVNIEKKGNKNTYIRVKEDLEIYVTTSYLVTNKFIENLIEENKAKIWKMIEVQKKRIEKSLKFYLLGNKYDIVLCDSFKKPVIDEDKIFVSSLKVLDKIGRDKASIIFRERMDICYNLINNKENIPYPNLRIRKMKGKWGHCKKSDSTVTLNLDLIKYEIDDIDYVIIHELSHLLHFNHSKEFWDCVERYKPNYKINRKHLREE